MIILLFFIELLAMGLLKNLDLNLELVSLIFIIINTFIMPFYIIKKTNNKKVAIIITIGYLIRLLLLIVDLYLFKIPPHSGADTEVFHTEAIKISENIKYMEVAHAGLYTKFIGIIYFLFGVSRIFIQYLNVIVGTEIIIVLYQVLQRIKIQQKVVRISIIIMTFFPHNIIFSSILLREALIGYLVIKSFYYFVNWTISFEKTNVIKTFICLIAGSALHAGIIGFIIAYILGFSFYSKDGLKINNRKISIFILLFILLFGVLYVFKDTFLAKLGIMDDKEYMFSWMSVERGSSSYLSWMEINSFKDVLIYAPLKMLYFIISPVIWEFRGISDVVTFILDSVLYIFLFYHLYKLYRTVELKSDEAIKVKCGLLGIMLCIFLFSYGTFNTGTALRHRNKLISIVILIWSILYNKRKINKKEGR